VFLEMKPFLTSVIRYVESWLFQRKPESRTLHCVIPIFDFRSNKKGFTLIELIIFIVVGAIILPASFVAFTAAIKHFSTPDYYVKARFFAEQKMEELTSNTYNCTCISRVNSPLGLCQIGSDRYDCSVGNNSDIPEINWGRAWSICYVPANDINSSAQCTTYTTHKRIEITITPPSGVTDNYTVSTLITRRPKASP
jgi:prepilin-type N-terminal cleavage/methylation domain-containing protein